MKKNLYHADAIDMAGFAMINRAALTYISNAKPLTPFEAIADLVYLTTGKATNTRVNGLLIHLGKNERILSQGYLATRWKWTPSKVKRFLSRLERDNLFIFKTEGRQGAKYVKIRHARAIDSESDHENERDNSTDNQRVASTDEGAAARPIEPASDHNTKSTKSTKIILCSTQGPNDEGEVATLQEGKAKAAANNRNAQYKADATRLIEKLNGLAGRSYKPDAPKSLDFTARRVKEHGYDALAAMLEFKVAEWKGTTSEKYLRPTTLFGSPTKTEGYVEEARQAISNPSLMAKIKQAKEVEKRRTEFLLNGKNGKGLHNAHRAPVSDDRLVVGKIYRSELEGVLRREKYDLAKVKEYWPRLSEEDRAKLNRFRSNPAHTQNDTYRLLLKLAFIAELASPEELFSEDAYREYQRAMYRMKIAV